MNEKTFETAKEYGACFPYPLGEKYGPQVVFTPTNFERFANRMKAEGMLEAAVLIEGEYYNDNYDTADSVLRSMAEQLGKGE